MIVVKVYHWPDNDPSREEEIGNMLIKNISNGAPCSDYEVLASERGSDVTGLPDQTIGFQVRNFIRRASPFGLVAAAAMLAARQFNEGKGRKAA